MTKADSAEYFNRFIAEQQSSLDRLASTIDRELTYSVESLAPVWECIRPKLAWRAGYTPPNFGQPGPRIELDQLEDANELPSWFHHPSGAGYARFSAQTLWLIDGAARYLGETVVRTTDGEWAIGRSRTKNYMFQNQPVLMRVGTEPRSPMQTCAVLASRALRGGTEPGPQTLEDVYVAWRS